MAEDRPTKISIGSDDDDDSSPEKIAAIEPSENQDGELPKLPVEEAMKEVEEGEKAGNTEGEEEVKKEKKEDKKEIVEASEDQTETTEVEVKKVKKEKDKKIEEENLDSIDVVVRKRAKVPIVIAGGVDDAVSNNPTNPSDLNEIKDDKETNNQDEAAVGSTGTMEEASKAPSELRRRIEPLEDSKPEQTGSIEEPKTTLSNNEAFEEPENSGETNDFDQMAAEVDQGQLQGTAVDKSRGPTIADLSQQKVVLEDEDNTDRRDFHISPKRLKHSPSAVPKQQSSTVVFLVVVLLLAAAIGGALFFYLQRADAF